jgi:hypothetical protein
MCPQLAGHSSRQPQEYVLKFDETGIFVAVCHHGLILTCVDMVQSGEL